jgi:class 3 adenylate cyclase
MPRIVHKIGYIGRIRQAERGFVLADLIMASSVAEPRRTYVTASVLFIDIVSYSLRTIDRQTELLTILQELVRRGSEFQRARANDELIILPTGDGMALVFMGDLISSVRCALEIADSLQARPEIEIRMGVHMGPVCRHSDIKEEINVVGSGINMAQRVMDCGDAGHILLSRSAAELLQQLDEWKDCLHDLGTHVVKHDVEIKLFSLCRSGLGKAGLPQRLAKYPAAVEERALDVAIATQLPILEPAELVGLVRQLASEGLRKVLENDPDSSVSPEDVRSKPVTIDFPSDENGRPTYRLVTVKIDSPDFVPTSQSVVIGIPPWGDSAPFTFLLTPIQLGKLRIKIQLYFGQVALLSRVVQTSATNSDRIPADVPRAVLTIPVSVLAPMIIPGLRGPGPLEQTGRLTAQDVEEAKCRIQQVLEKYPGDPRAVELIFLVERRLQQAKTQHKLTRVPGSTGGNQGVQSHKPEDTQISAIPQVPEPIEPPMFWTTDAKADAPISKSVLIGVSLCIFLLALLALYFWFADTRFRS